MRRPKPHSPKHPARPRKAKRAGSGHARLQGEARFQSLLQNISDIVTIHELDGAILYATPSLERVTGYQPDELIGRNAFELIHPDDKLDARAEFGKVIEGLNSGVPTEFRLRRADGTWLYVEAVGTRMTDQSGAPRIVLNTRDITERRQAEQRVRREAERASALTRMAARLNANLDLDAVLKTVCEETALALRSPASGVHLYDDAIGLLRLAAILGLPQDAAAKARPLPRALYDEFVRRSGPVIVIPDIQDNASLPNRDLYAQLGIRTVARASMLRDGELVGTLSIYSLAEARRFDEDELSLLKALADQAAQAIIGARLFTETRRRADEFAALYETARALATHTDLPALLRIIVKHAMTLHRAPTGAMYLYDSVRRDLELSVVSGTDFAAGIRLQLGEGMAGRVGRTREPMIVENYEEWPGRSEKFASIPFAAILQVPMLYGGELIGVLEVAELSPATRQFTDADARLLSLFAAQAAGAVHNARLFEEKSRRIQELEAINQISTALRVARTLDEMLPLLLDETLAVLRTGAGVIWLYDTSRSETRRAAARGWFAQIDQDAAHPGGGIVGYVLAEGKTHISREIAADPQTLESTRPHVPAGWGGACVPIRSTDEIVGALYVSVQLPREIAAHEAHLLATLAEIAGAAIQRMRLHEQTERRLQRLTVLRAIDVTITGSLDLHLTLSTLLEQITTHLHLDAAAVLLLNPASQTLEYAAGRGFRGASIMLSRLRVGEGHAGRAALERRLVCIPDLPASGSVFARAQLLEDEQFIVYCGAPLVAKGRLRGILEIFHRSPLNPDPEWNGFLESLAAQAAIAIDNASLFNNLQRANRELALAYDATIEGWSRALDLRDRETEGHTRRVTELTLRLARALGVSEADLVHIRRGALLHDIGKMGIPDDILLKPGPLTRDEVEIMNKHPVYAYEMLSPIHYLAPALDIPYCHHERWDGSGYPRGLRGEQIPLAARIFAVVDVWDALMADRPYRRAWPENKVRDHIRALANAHFDPGVVEAFLKTGQ